MYSIELKVKRLSLQAEARIIHVQEHLTKEEGRKARWAQKAERAARKMATWESLYKHRLQVVRPEARAAHIANAFLRGLPYEKVEAKIMLDRLTYDYSYGRAAHTKFWTRVVDIVYKFGGFKNKGEVENEVLNWRNQHPQYKTRRFP